MILANIASDRLHHACIFSGPGGVGRRTTAIALAKLILCEKDSSEQGLFTGGDQPGNREACGVCESCRMMDADTHPDFHLVYKELIQFHSDKTKRDRKMQAMGIDVVREFLIDPAGRRPVRGVGRIFLILEAELLSTEAQNALLKTLEEPPAGVMIILMCPNPELLLPTTRSRCGLYRFAPLSTEFIVSRLAAEDIDRTEGAFWAAFTGGSLGESLDLAKRGVYEIKTEVVDDIARLDADNGENLGEKLNKITEKMSEEIIKRTKKKRGVELSVLLARRKATAVMVRIVASLVNDAMAVSAEVDRAPVNADQPGAIQRMASRMDAVHLARAIRQLSELERCIWRNVNPKVVWDNVVITCSSAAPLHL